MPSQRFNKYSDLRKMKIFLIKLVCDIVVILLLHGGEEYVNE